MIFLTKFILSNRLNKASIHVKINHNIVFSTAALDYGKDGDSVTVFANNTDLIIMLMYFWKEDMVQVIVSRKCLVEFQQ